MDVLKPQLIWIGDKCYRFFDSNVWANTRNVTPYIEDNEQLVYEGEEICDSDIDIKPCGAIKFMHTFHVAKAFHPFIVGSKNAVRKRLESETKTSIQLPKIREEGDVVIIGSSRQGIISARRRIDLLIEASKKRIRHTHFLSIPLNEGHIIMKFNTFKTDVLNSTENLTRPIDNEFFQTPSKLHLTIGMLRLLDDDERKQATDALEHCKEHIMKPILEKYGQINIRLQGLSIMNDDPSEASVLYAEVNNADEGLQELVDSIFEYYSDIGLIKSNYMKVKLHATLISTRFKDKEKGGVYGHRETFDAREILKNHKDTFFGETVLKQIHISQLGTISSNGYYQAISKINLLETE